MESFEDFINGYSKENPLKHKPISSEAEKKESQTRVTNLETGTSNDEEKK
jgi:hypothetical protein